MDIFFEVKEELESAQKNFGPMRSEHEGFAVLKEEVDELWEAVRLKQSDPTRKDQVRKEAVQVAAMAMRFLNDVCGEQSGNTDGVHQENV
jgi:NTP pyrophosphatase (non-canonical NTP hydrolase)